MATRKKGSGSTVVLEPPVNGPEIVKNELLGGSLSETRLVAQLEHNRGEIPGGWQTQVTRALELGLVHRQPVGRAGSGRSELVAGPPPTSESGGTPQTSGAELLGPSVPLDAEIIKRLPVTLSGLTARLAHLFGVTPEQVREQVDALGRTGELLRTEQDGEVYLAATNWSNWQKAADGELVQGVRDHMLALVRTSTETGEPCKKDWLIAETEHEFPETAHNLIWRTYRNMVTTQVLRERGQGRDMVEVGPAAPPATAPQNAGATAHPEQSAVGSERRPDGADGTTGGFPAVRTPAREAMKTTIVSMLEYEQLPRQDLIDAAKERLRISGRQVGVLIVELEQEARVICGGEHRLGWVALLRTAPTEQLGNSEPKTTKDEAPPVDIDARILSCLPATRPDLVTKLAPEFGSGKAGEIAVKTRLLALVRVGKAEVHGEGDGAIFARAGEAPNVFQLPPAPVEQPAAGVAEGEPGAPSSTDQRSAAAAPVQEKPADSGETAGAVQETAAAAIAGGPPARPTPDQIRGQLYQHLKATPLPTNKTAKWLRDTYKLSIGEASDIIEDLVSERKMLRRGDDGLLWAKSTGAAEAAAMLAGKQQARDQAAASTKPAKASAPPTASPEPTAPLAPSQPGDARTVLETLQAILSAGDLDTAKAAAEQLRRQFEAAMDEKRPIAEVVAAVAPGIIVHDSTAAETRGRCEVWQSYLDLLDKEAELAKVEAQLAEKERAKKKELTEKLAAVKASVDEDWEDRIKPLETEVTEIEKEVSETRARLEVRGRKEVSTVGFAKARAAVVASVGSKQLPAKAVPTPAAAPSAGLPSSGVRGAAAAEGASAAAPASNPLASTEDSPATRPKGELVRPEENPSLFPDETMPLPFDQVAADAAAAAASAPPADVQPQASADASGASGSEQGERPQIELERAPSSAELQASAVSPESALAKTIWAEWTEFSRSVHGKVALDRIQRAGIEISGAIHLGNLGSAAELVHRYRADLSQVPDAPPEADEAAGDETEAKPAKRSRKRKTQELVGAGV